MNIRMEGLKIEHKLRQIYNYFGKASQLAKLVEESQELHEECIKYEQNPSEDGFYAILDELADTLVVIMQIAFKKGFTLEYVYAYVLNQIRVKMNRTIDLIDLSKNNGTDYEEERYR